MKISSATFPLRASCKWCHSLPTYYKVYNVYMPAKDIFKELKSYDQEQNFVVSIRFMDDIMISKIFKFSEFKVNFGQFSYYAANKINPKFHRKFNHKEKNLNKIRRSCVSTCMCGRSYWIDYYFDPKIFPENNRKRSVL